MSSTDYTRSLHEVMETNHGPNAPCAGECPEYMTYRCLVEARKAINGALADFHDVRMDGSNIVRARARLEEAHQFLVRNQIW